MLQRHIVIVTDTTYHFLQSKTDFWYFCNIPFLLFLKRNEGKAKDTDKYEITWNQFLEGKEIMKKSVNFARCNMSNICFPSK